MSLADTFILLAIRDRSVAAWTPVGSFDGKRGFRRWEPFWPDERVDSQGVHHNRPPWWRPFNVLLHWWRPANGYAEVFHDHPRWSVTICLRGRIIEETPWRTRVLHPGSVVVRSRKFIHRIRPLPAYSGRTWTLFIVGRRNYVQSDYVVKSRAGHRGQVHA